MIPLAVPNLTGNERTYLNQCIDTTFVSSVGEFVNKFELMVRESSGAGYSVATSSGTTALHLALVGCGVKRDELVIIPSFTFIATANAVSHCGAIPWLMDVKSESWTMDADMLEKELSEKTEKIGGNVIHKETGRRVAAIMPVYTLGTPADMDKIMAVAGLYSLPVVADAAAALGSFYKGIDIGGIADITVFSFNGNKTVTSGGGGMVVGNNEQQIRRIRHISTTARVGTDYDHDEVGYNYRMTNIQAAVGCAQMERLDEFVAAKRRIRDYYDNAFKSIRGISKFPRPAWAESACWFSGIVLEDQALPSVKELCTVLKENGIEGRTFWKPVHLQQPYEHVIRPISLDYTQNLWNRIMTLPCSTNITEQELEHVVRTVKTILK